MCELYYLDHFREAVAEKKAEAAAMVLTAEKLMSEGKASMKIMSERTAKLMLDLAFSKITYMSDDLAQERLIRYAAGLCLKAKDYRDMLNRND